MSFHRRIKISGTIESDSFSINAASRGDALTQCMNSNFNAYNVDEIYYSVNGKPLKSHVNRTGYYQTKPVVCRALLKLIDAEI